MQNHPALLIKKKRDSGELTDAEIRDLVSGVVDGSLGDGQLGAFTMAVCCNGMTVEETRALTLAMRDSGRVLDLSHIDKPKVDKHSTGGVGDKISLLLAPLVAAAGVAVPMISGRGLGHTGGTIDKLQSIPGYRTELSVDEFLAVLASCGYAMAGASADIAPADRRMYALRDVSGTVESIPLICSSILSKKLAEGIDGLVMDVKCGRAAFMQKEHDAVTLMERIVETGRAAGIKVTALLTDMDVPLGRAIGNGLEVAEILDCLEGKGRHRARKAAGRSGGGGGTTGVGSRSGLGQRCRGHRDVAPRNAGVSPGRAARPAGEEADVVPVPRTKTARTRQHLLTK